MGRFVFVGVSRAPIARGRTPVLPSFCYPYSPTNAHSVSPPQRTHRPITSQYPLETTTCVPSIHEQCAIGIFFLRLLLWQLLLKLLRIQFLNRSYPGTPPFRCRESRPYHEEPRLKTSFYDLILSTLAALFLHCSPMVTLTSLPALSLQHTEVELYSGRRRRSK